MKYRRPQYITPEYVYSLFVRGGGFVVSREYFDYRDYPLDERYISTYNWLPELTNAILWRIMRGSYGSDKVEGLRLTFRKIWVWTNKKK